MLNLSTWQIYVATALFWAPTGAIIVGVATGEWLGAVWGFVLGLIAGPLVYRAQRRNRGKG